MRNKLSKGIQDRITTPTGSDTTNGNIGMCCGSRPIWVTEYQDLKVVSAYESFKSYFQCEICKTYYWI